MSATLPQLDDGDSKESIVAKFRDHLNARGFTVTEIDAARPWGAFLRIANEQADRFIDTYFGDLDVPLSAREGERSPKFLLVAPHQRLSWQYHNNRAEYWRAIRGPVGVFISTTDVQPTEPLTLRAGETIELEKGERHRLVGLENWGVVAEIWIHTDSKDQSDENDIVRLQDDYARNSPA